MPRRPSVVDHTAQAERERAAALSPGERVALALGERDIASYAAAHGLDRAAARRALERRRQAGRRRSGCIEALLA